MSSYSVAGERNRTFQKRLCSCFKFVAQKKIKAHLILISVAVENVLSSDVLFLLCVRCTVTLG